MMKKCMLSVAVATAFLAQGASAQFELEEIIVTAQKRAESIQDIPSSVSAVSGEALQEFNLLNFSDVEALSAGLGINKDTGRSGSITLRGITFDPSSAADAAVTVYQNDSVVDGNSAFQQMFDIERIEVLRGPQGTLAGRPSPAGVINIHTAKANPDQIEGYVRGVFTDNDGVNTQGAINLPLIEGKLAVRVAAIFDESDLNEVENHVSGEMSNDETEAARLSLNWRPTDSLDFDFTYQYLENDVTSISVLEGVPSGAPGLDPVGVLQSLSAFDKRGVRVGSDQTSSKFENTTLNISWDIDSHEISSVTGYHKTDSIREFDRAEGNANPDFALYRTVTDERTDFIQEFRIANTDSATWEYMIGAYYEHSKAEFSQLNELPSVHPAAPGGAVVSFPAEVNRYGLFTHNKFHLTDAWTLHAGLRYQEVEIERDLSLLAGPDGFIAAPPNTLVYQVLSEENKDDEDSAITGSLALHYVMSENLSFYSNISTGWRPGGITISGSPLPEDLLLFEDENSISYELGFKSTLMDGTMRLSGAFYYQEFEDYISRIEPLNTRELTGDIRNANLTTNSDFDVWGLELDVDVNLSKNWFIGAGLSYSKGEYADGESLPCNVFNAGGLAVIPAGESVSTCDASGQELDGTPDWSLTLNTEYVIPLDDFELYGRVLYRHIGERSNQDLGDLNAYDLVDLHLGIRGQQWEISAFARNLFDEEEVHDGSFATQSVAGRPTGYGARQLVPSRLVGLTLAYRY